ncbi:hypothetical protein D9M69_653520 [compost metagenome]
MPDTDPQPPVVGAAQLGMDVAQTIVASVSAPFLELHFAGWQVKLVVHHEHFFRRNLEKPSQRTHRFAREVHEGLRLDQPHALASHGCARDQAEVTPFHLQRDLEQARRFIHPPETGVVAGVFVFRTRIAQAGDELDHAQIIGWQE